MPLSHQDTKFHKVLNINIIFLVKLGVLVPWWQKATFPNRLNILLFNYLIILK